MMCGVSSVIQAQNPVGQLPDQFQSYQVSEKLSYTDKNLFEYINGGAEMYRSYGLIGMEGRKYAAENLPEVSIDVYEMTEAKNAFGIFTQSRDREEYDYGQGSQSMSDAIIFWKDRYFVVISTAKVVQQSDQAIKYFASAIDKAIPQKGKIPDIVGCLPEQNLAPAGVLYFHHYIWLNAYLFIADYNIININDQADAVLAKYGTPESRSYLLLAAYPNGETAKKGYEQLKQKFAPEAKANESVQIEDKKWVKVWMKGNKLGAIFNGNTKEVTEQLYQSAFNKM